MREFTFTCTDTKTGHSIELVYLNKTEKGARSRCTKALNQIFGNTAAFKITMVEA